MKQSYFTAAVFTGAILGVGGANAGLIAGVDFDVPGDIDGDPNTPNTVLTEPGFASQVAGGSKDYNLTTNGITFDFDGTSTAGNANRLRNGAIRNFPLTTDFMQLNSSNTPSDIPTLVITISGLDANTEYTIETFHYNAGAFQQPHEIYEGSIAPGNLITTFTASGNPNDPQNFEPGSEIALTSDGSGAIVVAIQPGGGNQRLTFNGIAVTPEPSSLALIGLGGLLVARRRRG